MDVLKLGELYFAYCTLGVFETLLLLGEQRKMQKLPIQILYIWLSFVYLKVHKNENFFGFDFEFCTVSLLVMLKYEAFVTNFF